MWSRRSSCRWFIINFRNNAATNSACRSGMDQSDAANMRFPAASIAARNFSRGNASVQGVELCSIVEAMLSLETAIRISGDAAVGLIDWKQFHSMRLPAASRQ